MKTLSKNNLSFYFFIFVLCFGYGAIIAEIKKSPEIQLETTAPHTLFVKCEQPKIENVNYEAVHSEVIITISKCQTVKKAKNKEVKKWLISHKKEMKEEPKKIDLIENTKPLQLYAVDCMDISNIQIKNPLS